MLLVLRERDRTAITPAERRRAAAVAAASHSVLQKDDWASGTPPEQVTPHSSVYIRCLAFVYDRPNT
jgi:hypothetical protein